MMKDVIYIKEWTILIYANGNNELEPEIWKSKINAEKSGSDSNINVIMQIGRESRDLSRLIRPHATIPPADDCWTGVRRYYIQDSNSIILNDMGPLNMADPSNLNFFIRWGIENYPAKRFLLMLSGHGASPAAVMPDFGQKYPCMMTIPGMCRAITSALNHHSHSKIDLLILDICDMNLIEILYEFKHFSDYIFRLITYAGDGPLSGIPCCILNNVIKDNLSELDIDKIARNILDELDLDLISIKLDNKLLTDIKQTANNLAAVLLRDPQIPNAVMLDPLNAIKDGNPYFPEVQKLKRMLDSIIQYARTPHLKESNLLQISSKKLYSSDTIDDFMNLYNMFAFSRNNCWYSLLSGNDVNHSEPPLADCIFLSPRGMKNIIWSMNPGADDDAVNTILERLYELKKWNTPHESSTSHRPYPVFFLPEQISD